MKFRYYNDSMKNYLVISCSDGKTAGQRDPNDKMRGQGNPGGQFSVQGCNSSEMSEQHYSDEASGEPVSLNDKRSVRSDTDSKMSVQSDPAREEKDAANEEESIGYQYQMISANHITGLLPCSLRKINGELLLYVDITSLQSMDSLFRSRKMTAQQQKKFLYSLSDTGESISRFLLDSRRLLSDPRFIFYSYAKDAWYFVYYPKEEKGNYQKLFQFLCGRTDPSDKMAAALIYQLCDMADSPNFVLDGKLLDHLYDTENGIYTRESGYGYVPKAMGKSAQEDRNEENPMREPYDVMDRGKRTYFQEEPGSGPAQEQRNAADAGQGWMDDAAYSAGFSGSYMAGSGRPRQSNGVTADGRRYQAEDSGNLGGYRQENYAADGRRYQTEALGNAGKYPQQEGYAGDSRRCQTTGTAGARQETLYGAAGQPYQPSSEGRNSAGNTENYRWANAENLYSDGRLAAEQAEPQAAQETQNQLSHVLMIAFICLAVAAGAEFLHVRFHLNEMVDLAARAVAAAGLAGCVLLASYGVYLAWKRKKEERDLSEESSQPRMQPTLDFRNGQLSGGIMMGEQQRQERIR